MDQLIRDLIHSGGFNCTCGRHHSAELKDLILESGALRKIPDLMKRFGGSNLFILTDCNAYAAAGKTVCALLEDAEIPYTLYIFPQMHLEPDEQAVGAAAMHFDVRCDVILGVGSGVINDICKILSNLTRTPYLIVATAPSMDGYASATSSMARDGLKISLNSTCPLVIIADLNVLCGAPMRMLQSGLGDMVAKYISICEWRIANLLVDEPFCPVIAQMVRDAVSKCIQNAKGLAARDPDAVAAVMEGLVVTGLAMSYAGLSRPASGMEHYFSHIWDMRGLEFGTATSTHGIQCGIGTLLSIAVYDQIRQITPDGEKALAFVSRFDTEAWNEKLSRFLGNGAAAMIAGEKKEGKYDVQKHAPRLERIIRLWPQILAIIRQEIPDYKAVLDALLAVGAPTQPEEIGLTKDEVRTAFLMTKDIRDKYIASRLLWDLGCLDDVADRLFS